MRVLLDTHVLMWSQGSPRKLGRTALSLLDRSDVFVSSASLWEVSLKAVAGKCKVRPHELLTAAVESGFQLLPVTPDHAIRVFDLGTLHADPFDRLLVAQAKVEALTLLTRDTALAHFGDVVRLI